MLTELPRRRQGMLHRHWVLAHDMRKVGYSWVEIADAFRKLHGVNALTAMRLAHGWSQRDVAERWTARWPDEPKTFKAISYWETWRQGAGHKPDLVVLDRLARIYECRVSDLVADLGDYRPVGEVSRVDGVAGPAAAAFARAEALEREVLARWPMAWVQLDELRREPLGPWPYWCLLPSTAAAMVAGWSSSAPTPAAAICALYAWRFSRSVYVYRPEHAASVLRVPPDDLTDADPLTVLPEWCVYVAGGHPDWPGAGLWAYLDVDYVTGRPLLRLLIDITDGGLDALTPIPVWLDLPLTQAVAESRGGGLSAENARVAEIVDRLVAVVTHPANLSADIARVGEGLSRRPIRSHRPVQTRTVWAIGYNT